MPPRLWVVFVWNSEASRRCGECGKCGKGLDEGREYCSADCARAGLANVCRCGMKLDVVHPYCSTCKRGQPASSSGPVEQFAMVQRLFFGEAEVKDPNHEPAWKKCRR